MKKIVIGTCELEFDEALLEKYELITSSKLEDTIPSYLKSGFENEDFDSIVSTHTKEELYNKIMEYVSAEFLLV